MKNLEFWKLSMKRSLLLILKLIYFSNPCVMTFTLRLSLHSYCIIRCESWFFRLSNIAGILWFNLTLIWDYRLYVQNIYIFQWYDSDLLLNINIIFITDPAFSWNLKIFIIFFSHHKFFVKMFFHRITTIFTFFNHTANKIVNSIFT